MTLIEDWYRLRKGRELARDYIPAARIAAYAPSPPPSRRPIWPGDSLQARVAGILRMLRGYLDAPPSLDFRVDLATGEIAPERDLPRPNRAPPDRSGVKDGRRAGAVAGPLSDQRHDVVGDRIDRLAEGRQVVGGPAGLFDVVEADDAEVRRHESPNSNRAASMKPQASRSVTQKAASGRVEPLSRTRPASTPDA